MSWIPSLIGIQNTLFELPYRLLRDYASTPAPTIDYAKYFTPAVTTKDMASTQVLKEKYQLLDYVVEYWTYHTREMELNRKKTFMYGQLQDVAKHKSLSFDFRPWGSNRHFGKYGCVTCIPGSAVSQTAAKKLPFMNLLHYAAEIGHWPLMEPLVQEYCRHESGYDTTLVIACRNNHLGIVKQLTQLLDFDLSTGKAVNAAAAAGHGAVLTYLVDEAARTHPFNTSEDGHHPLLYAAANGHETVIDLLHARGADVDAIGQRELKESPLLMAARNGHDRVVRSLLSKNARIVTSGTTALHAAAENGHEAVVRSLLEPDPLKHTGRLLFSPPQEIERKQTPLLWPDRENETPLLKAARNGHSSVVKVLLEQPFKGHRSWLGAKTRDGLEAVHLAATNGHEGVLALLSSHVSIDSITQLNKTPLMLAAAGGHVSAIERLVANGASITSVRRDPETEIPMDALKIAACCGHEEAVHILFNYTQQKHASCLTDDYLSDLLFLAARKRHMDVLATVIERIRPIHEPSHLLTVLMKAKTSALTGNLVDAAQLLSSLITSVSREKMSPRVQHDETHYPYSSLWAGQDE